MLWCFSRINRTIKRYVECSHNYKHQMSNYGLQNLPGIIKHFFIIQYDVLFNCEQCKRKIIIYFEANMFVRCFIPRTIHRIEKE